MLSRVLFTVAVAASTAMAVALPKEVTLPQEIVPQAVIASKNDVEANPWTLVSPDGTCGGDTKYTCLGSRFGDCCNTYGFCGVTDAFCGADCFNLAGLCDADPQNSNVVSRPKATHVPWKPTVHHDPHFKPSYVIDNGERAPNQVWS